MSPLERYTVAYVAHVETLRLAFHHRIVEEVLRVVIAHEDLELLGVQRAGEKLDRLLCGLQRIHAELAVRDEPHRDDLNPGIVDVPWASKKIQVLAVGRMVHPCQAHAEALIWPAFWMFQTLYVRLDTLGFH